MSGSAEGAVRKVLRLEGLCVLVAAVTAYAELGLHWRIFALFFLAPDLSFCGYLAGPRLGSITYNAAHSYIGAVTTLLVGWILAVPGLLCAGLIWCGHIGFDRALGYGLKYSAGFGFTHLGRVGRRPAVAAASTDVE